MCVTHVVLRVSCYDFSYNSLDDMPAVEVQLPEWCVCV